MICPVCQHSAIPSLATTCPVCDANLVGIKLLDALEDQYVDTVKEKVALEGAQVQQKIEYEAQLKKKNKRNNWLLFFLFLVSLGYYFLGQPTQKEIPPVIVQATDSIDVYKDRLIETEKELESIHQKLAVIKSTQNIREIEYIVKKGDMLFDLGLLFYNDSPAWYQIALDNKIYDIKGLPIGDTLKIKYRE